MGRGGNLLEEAAAKLEEAEAAVQPTACHTLTAGIEPSSLCDTADTRFGKDSDSEAAAQLMQCFTPEEPAVVPDAMGGSAVNTDSGKNLSCSLPVAQTDGVAGKDANGHEDGDTVKPGSATQLTVNKHEEIARFTAAQPETTKHAVTDVAKPAVVHESEALAPIGEVESIATKESAIGESELKSDIAKPHAPIGEVEAIAMKQLAIGETEALVHIVEEESQVAEQTTIGGCQLLVPCKDATSKVAGEHVCVDELETQSIKPPMIANFPGSEAGPEITHLATDGAEEPTRIDEVESVVIEHPIHDEGEALVDVADQVTRQQRTDESENHFCVGEIKLEVAETLAVLAPHRHPSDASEHANNVSQDSASSTSGDTVSL